VPLTRHTPNAVYWAKPNLLIGLTCPESCSTTDPRAEPLGGTVEAFDPATRRVSKVAGWDNLVVSPNGRWIAGVWGGPGPTLGGTPTTTVQRGGSTVGLLSLNGLRNGKCRFVPHDSHHQDAVKGFSADGTYVIVVRTTFPSYTLGQSKHVQYSLHSLPTSKIACSLPWS
jgi:hypothetical protein